MGRLAGKVAIAALSTATAWLMICCTASASIAFHACRRNNDLACGRLTVRLDPSGSTPGTISLAIRRHRAPVGPAHTAVVALAGGPGQPAIPFTEGFRHILGSILRTRDLIVFDQRGTGISHPLSCHAFEVSGDESSVGGAVSACARQIGKSRRFYTSMDSVEDIEAIRVAGGYEKLVLYGTSYGTKVAEMYAEAHPEHVEALILDSVVTPDGPEPLALSTFAAVPGVLKRLCSFRECSGITRDPVAELRRLVTRIERKRLHGEVVSGDGHAHSMSISSDDLLGLLLEGDLDPLMRSEFPAAVASALHGDAAPIARLLSRGEGEEAGPAAIDIPLYYATTCEEQAFPWSRSSSPRRRLAEAKKKIDTLRPRSLSPFTRRNVLDMSDVEACAAWPFAAPAPVLGKEILPAVPTLILSGTGDLRTPTADARSLAAKIPRSHLLVVPNAGHDVLGTEQSSCGLHALRALFAHRPIRRCKRTPPPSFLRPTRVAPRSLDAVKQAKGYEGGAGRTLTAVGLSLSDLSRQLTISILEGDASGSGSAVSLSSGGLRGGWARLTHRHLTLHRYSYVPGVTISGEIRAESAKLTVGGHAASHGTLSFGPDRRFTGDLEGVSVSIAAKTLTQGARLASAASMTSTRELRALPTIGELIAATGDLSPGAGGAATQALSYALSHQLLRKAASRLADGA